MWDLVCLMGNYPSVAPIPRSLPQNLFGASTANSPIVCPLWSGNPRSLIIVYFWISFHTDAISAGPIVDLPLPGGGGAEPLPLPTPINPNRRLPRRSGWWGGGREGAFTVALRRGENSGGEPSLVPGWLRLCSPFPLYSIIDLSKEVLGPRPNNLIYWYLFR